MSKSGRTHLKISTTASIVAVLIGISTPLAGLARDYYKDGCAFYKNGQLEYALKCFKHITEKNPKHWPAQYHLGNTYMKLNQRMKAREAYDKCLRTAGADPNTMKACQKAIKKIDLMTAEIEIAKMEAEKAAKEGKKNPEAKKAEKPVKKLSPREEARIQAHEKRVAKLKAQKEKILNEARAKASRIRDQANQRIANMERNSQGMVINSRTGASRLGISSRVREQIISEAESKARAIMRAAESRARGIRIPKNPI